MSTRPTPVVDDDDGLGAVPLGDAGDLFEVGDLEERVRRRFETCTAVRTA
jgi:hypothetical protein